MKKDAENAYLFHKKHAITCLNLKEDNLNFVFKWSLCCMLKILLEEHKKKGVVGGRESYRCCESFFNLLLNI